jgi:hypothetical protein
VSEEPIDAPNARAGIWDGPAVRLRSKIDAIDRTDRVALLGIVHPDMPQGHDARAFV